MRESSEDEEGRRARLSQCIPEKGVADGRKPSGPGRPRYTGGLAPYRYTKFKHALVIASDQTLEPQPVAERLSAFRLRTSTFALPRPVSRETISPLPPFHVKHPRFPGCAVSVTPFHVKRPVTPTDYSYSSELPLLERINDQPAQQLGIEVRALGRHPLLLVADLANMLQRGGHHQGC